MRNAYRHLIVPLSSLLLAACEMSHSEKTATVVPTPQFESGSATLEIESFTLTEAPIQPLNGASGKAVLFQAVTSSAKTSINLPRGAYEATLYIQASDPDHDAVVLSIAGQDTRLFTNDYDHLVAVDETVRFTHAQDGPCAIALTAAETGVLLDKLVIKRTTP